MTDRHGPRVAGWIPAALGSAALLGGWWLVAHLAFDGRGVVPDPWLVLVDVAEHTDFFVTNGVATARAALEGFVWGNLLALALALLCAVAPAATRLVMPPSVVAYSMPLIAVAPILVVVFGGDTPSVVLAALAVFFPTLINTLSGLMHADKTALDVVAACGGGRWAHVLKVRSWAALPGLAAGLKIAAPSALLGAILGEFLGRDRGLGIALVVAQQNGDAVRTWSIAVVCTALAGLAYAAIALGERALIPWGDMSDRVART